VACRAGIRDFVLIRHGRADKSKSMTSNVNVRDGLFDLWHMTGDTLATRTARFVMCMLFDCAYVWAIGRAWPVTFEAHDVRWLDQQGIVIRTVNIVATGALHTACVHDALNEVVALHAVLVCRAVRKVGECRLAQSMLFELPVIL